MSNTLKKQLALDEVSYDLQICSIIEIVEIINM